MNAANQLALLLMPKDLWKNVVSNEVKLCSVVTCSKSNDVVILGTCKDIPNVYPSAPSNLVVRPTISFVT